MRTFVLLLALCVTCFAVQAPNLEIVVPSSAAHPSSWLRPQIRENPKPASQGKSAASLAEFVAPEVISKIVVDQYAGPPDDVRRYLAAMPAAATRYFGPTLGLCQARVGPSGLIPGASLTWTSTSILTFNSGRNGRLSVATVDVSRVAGKGFGSSVASDCFGFDKVPVGSLYVSYEDPDGYVWAFAIPLK